MKVFYIHNSRIQNRRIILLNSFSLICTYDPAGNQTAVYRGREKAGKKQAAQSLTYDAQGNITGVEDGNGKRMEFVLDDLGSGGGGGLGKSTHWKAVQSGTSTIMQATSPTPQMQMENHHVRL